MKAFTLATMLILFVFPANAILVDSENDEASKILGASLPQLGSVAWWEYEGGTRYGSASCTLVKNDARDGAWILTAAHVVLRDSGEMLKIMRCCFYPNYYDGFPKGTTSYLPDKTATIINSKVFFPSSQDLALCKLDHLVYNASGELVAPAKFYTGELVEDMQLLIAGTGETGTPSEARIGGTGKFDGYSRAVRCRYYYFLLSQPSIGITHYDATLSVPGLANEGDSGGLAAVEQGGDVYVVGNLNQIRGEGITAANGFEYLDSQFFTWMNNIIASNGEQSCVTGWLLY